MIIGRSSSKVVQRFLINAKFWWPLQQKGKTKPLEISGFKIFFWGGISSDIRSEFFYGEA